MIKSLVNADLDRSKAPQMSEWAMAADTFRNLVRIVHLVKKFWFRQGLLSLFSLIFIPLGLLNPYLGQIAVDGPLMHRQTGAFFRIGLLMGGLSLGVMMLQNLYTYLQSRLTIDAREYITGDLYEKLTRQSLEYFRRSDRNASASILTGDGVEVVLQSLTILPDIAVSMLHVAVKLVVVFVIDWRLGLIALLSPPLYAFQAMVLARRNREVAKVEREAHLAYAKELSDSIGNMDLVKSFHSEEYHIHKFSKSLRSLSNLWRGNERFALYFGWAAGALRKIIDGLPVIFASYLVTRGSLSLGQMTAAVLYTMQFLAANAKLVDFVPRLGSLYMQVNIFTQFMKTQPAITEAPNAKDVDFNEGRVTVENVSFAYIPGIPVLRGISLNIEPDRWTGIKAPSGYGKTTLINLITRVYDADHGRILIDGHDVRKIKFKSLHDQISIVLQQSFLTRDPIWKCIAYDRESATRGEIEQAARTAGIHEQIMGLSNGYDTLCSDLGLSLSQGQRQRIAIARALLRRPKILIMDEAFGSVDKATEDLIVSDMRRQFPRMTVIVISHHDSVLEKMDTVIELQKTERGVSASTPVTGRFLSVTEADA